MHNFLNARVMACRYARGTSLIIYPHALTRDGKRCGAQLIQSPSPVDEDSGITAFLQLHAASDPSKTIYNGAGGERR